MDRHKILRFLIPLLFFYFFLFGGVFLAFFQTLNAYAKKRVVLLENVYEKNEQRE
jgi:hypothetical protein